MFTLQKHAQGEREQDNKGNKNGIFWQYGPANMDVCYYEWSNLDKIYIDSRLWSVQAAAAAAAASAGSMNMNTTTTTTTTTNSNDDENETSNDIVVLNKIIELYTKQRRNSQSRYSSIYCL
ncbi:hypothetical protein FRACYDRAFT_251239 [Fragilariopsis cylindrus CCMP1102]|uniref:Uncharacterized protein n=1 Tax=Fragilariopsis cylindrus CCMP1102 TaxID=635003 RepID=A0A1E7ENK7_9STRA|nr:hypothetical protein FRACYDRAFT_251239 [Fragilariopsis cylindrus CCMP1102]|eukprot:OEU07434.1 hypothetical protein FRACYDRAFT_251239 [Fragilariopsis cylindrus CCMP1102]